jgi:hypothetical protein
MVNNVLHVFFVSTARNITLTLDEETLREARVLAHRLLVADGDERVRMEDEEEAYRTSSFGSTTEKEPTSGRRCHRSARLPKPARCSYRRAPLPIPTYSQNCPDESFHVGQIIRPRTNAGSTENRDQRGSILFWSIGPRPDPC